MQRTTKRVALIHMPWGALERPTLGLSILKSILDREGIASEVHYLNTLFADFVGAERYRWIAHDLPHIAFAGEWLFSEALYGVDRARDAAYQSDILQRQWRLTNEQIAELLFARRYVEPFLAHALASMRWSDFDLVGFTSTFEQNVASLALARRLSCDHPHLAIVFGGANWEGPMGVELHRAFPFVDYVCSGEADESFPALIRAHRAPRRARSEALRAVRGIVFRQEGASINTGPAAPIVDMDALPHPDFSGYFAARQRSPSAQQAPPVLVFESSRGCWWGAKSHCTFCGLNGHTMGFRSKSPGRMLDELRALTKQWPCPVLEAVDNILDMKYFETVLPELAKLDLPGELFYEVKANLKRHHVAALARAHITRIQPGIESLSSHILGLMRKGTTALRNVQLLKWCREYSISVDWNLLYGFPGERDQDYEEILALLPLIGHLQLAGACGPIRLDRFSPYFQQPHAFGLTNVQPIAPYRFLYPVEGMRVDEVAYYFDFAYRPGFEPSTLAREVAAQLEALRDGGNGGTLQATAHGAELYLRDTRPCARTPALKLSSYERTILECIDETRSLRSVMERLALEHPEDDFDANHVRAFLEGLVAHKLALREGEQYLSLVLMPASLRAPLESASRRAGRFALGATQRAGELADVCN